MVFKPNVLECIECNYDIGVGMRAAPKSEDGRTVNYHRWEKEDGVLVKKSTTSTDSECLPILKSNLEPFSLHLFNAKV